MFFHGELELYMILSSMGNTYWGQELIRWNGPSGISFSPAIPGIQGCPSVIGPIPGYLWTSWEHEHSNYDPSVACLFRIIFQGSVTEALGRPWIFVQAIPPQSCPEVAARFYSRAADYYLKFDAPEALFPNRREARDVSSDINPSFWESLKKRIFS